MPVCLILSIIIAGPFNTGLRTTGLFRVIYFLPNIMMPVAVAMVWKILLNSKFGIVNIALGWLGIQGPSWISDPNMIMTSIMIISIWSGLGYNYWRKAQSIFVNSCLRVSLIDSIGSLL